MRIYRPKKLLFFDLNLIVIWLLAILSILLGSLWSIYNIKFENLKIQLIQNQSNIINNITSKGLLFFLIIKKF